jgi:hypothetical protein
MGKFELWFLEVRQRAELRGIYLEPLTWKEYAMYVHGGRRGRVRV